MLYDDPCRLCCGRQDQTSNSYADEKNKFSRPQVFWGEFWEQNGLFQEILRIGQAEDAKGKKVRSSCLYVYVCVRVSLRLHVCAPPVPPALDAPSLTYRCTGTSCVFRCVCLHKLV